MRADLWRQIHDLHAELDSVRAVAKRLGVHRRTVREALRAEHPPRRAAAGRGSILDPYRGWILAKLGQYPELTAARIFQMLREQRYSGGYSLVKRCVHELRPRLKPAFASLTFAPGEAAQADWGCWTAVDVPGGRRMLSFFVMVLCHSRLLYAEFFHGQAAEHWLAAHRRAFEFFQAVPAVVIVDNCKTAVLEPGTGDRPTVYNPAYLDFARHYGFKPRACPPRKPNQKGIVENAVGFIRTSFLAGRPATALAPANAALAHWLDTVANVRIHGTTGRPPLDLYRETERDLMRPLPAGPHPCTVNTAVAASSRCRVLVDTNRYSVPIACASRRLTLRLTDDRVTLADGDRVVADHPRSPGRRQTVADPLHEREHTLRSRHAVDRRQLGRVLALGTHAEAYLAGLREKRPDWRGHVRRINALAETFGRDEVARLLADAREHEAFSSDYILNILEARQRKLPEPGALHLTRGEDLLDIELPDPDLDIY
ncbi:MAG: IS21 family transposase [Polyangiaceae bacterium]|nr:IS21 family transposase [Polyangiaceae bacterium]